MRGTYLVLKIADEVVAETTSVHLKVKAKQMDSTSQDNGLNAGHAGGTVKIAIAGAFLFSENNWDTLYDSIGNEFEVALYRDTAAFLEGYGILKKLSARGADSGKKVTGTYGISYKVSTSEQVILTEDGWTILTEDGESMILE